MRIPDGIDGIEVRLRCACVCCKKECVLYAAGLPQTVQAYVRMAAGEYLMAFVNTNAYADMFPLGYHVSLKDRTDVAIDERVFKWQAAQVASSISNSSMPKITDDWELKVKRRKSVEALLARVRSQPKRVKTAMTDAGTAFP